MREIKIRLMKNSEIETVVELTNLAYQVPYYAGKLITRANDTSDKTKLELEKGARILVASLNGKIVGAVRLDVSQKPVVLYKLAVDKECRNQGVGSELINYIFQYSKTEGINSLMIEVTEEKGLIPYYENFGFIVSKRYFNKDHFEVLMVKTGILDYK